MPLFEPPYFLTGTGAIVASGPREIYINVSGLKKNVRGNMYETYVAFCF